MQSLKTAIGLMSGTSMDGIDGALIRSDGEMRIEVLAHISFEYPADFRRQMKQALKTAQTMTQRMSRPGNLALVEKDLTSYHASIVQHLLDKQNLSASEVDLIGFHGQTILHRPEAGLTVQLGLGADLARQTGIDVIYDMRAQDMAHGGQGAPLTPIYHAVLAAKLQERIAFPCCFVNIGGITNLTFIPKPNRTDIHHIMAFDCGPGNCLIDQWMERRTGRPFDADGQTALRGCVNEAVLRTYQEQDIFTRSKARSLDWHDFAPLTDDKISSEDGAATLTLLSAWAIFHKFNRLPAPPKTLIISGGGAKNLCLMRALNDLGREKNITIMSAQQCGLNSDFIEAEAWGYLAIRARRKLPLSFPKTTGVQFPVTGGVFSPFSQGRDFTAWRGTIKSMPKY